MSNDVPKKATPRKDSGRPSKLMITQIDALVNFITSSKKRRQMTYPKLSDELDFDVHAVTIKRAIDQREYHRQVALRKPPISQANSTRCQIFPFFEVWGTT